MDSTHFGILPWIPVPTTKQKLDPNNNNTVSNSEGWNNRKRKKRKEDWSLFRIEFKTVSSACCDPLFCSPPKSRLPLGLGEDGQGQGPHSNNDNDCGLPRDGSRSHFTNDLMGRKGESGSWKKRMRMRMRMKPAPSLARDRETPNYYYSSSCSRSRYASGRYSSLLVLLALVLGLCQVSEECPAVCECKWKSGKESVICANAKTKLTEIPSGLDPGTQVSLTLKYI